MEQAKVRERRYDAVVASVFQKSGKNKKFTNPKRFAEFESVVLKGIIDYELKTNPKDTWNFGNLAQVMDDFFLLREFFNLYESQHLKRLCDRFGDYFLTDADHQAIGQLPPAEQEAAKVEKMKEYVRPLWVLFVALCHALQEGEDWGLTAIDAFWLGLIDEVVGVPDLPTYRRLVEQVPDPPQQMLPLLPPGQ